LFGPLDPLADVLVHGGDIRISLGLPFSPQPERVELALDFLTGNGALVSCRWAGCAAFVCAAQTSTGRGAGGAEVRGPAAALMMTVSGRTALIDTLDGPGVPLLRHRLAIP
jgi:hypothetical protein